MKNFHKQPMLLLIFFILTSFQFFAQTSITQNIAHNSLNWADVGQSFTATQDGVITNIQVVPNFAGTSTLSIYSGAGIGGTLLYTQYVTFTDHYNSTSDFSFQTIVINAPVNITNGSVYTFKLSGINSFALAAADVYYGGTLISGTSIYSNWELTFKILQGAGNTAPTFTSTAVTSINENQTYTYTVTTNDIDGDNVTLTAPTLPSWLSLDANITVSTFAGSGTPGSVDDTGTSAQFNTPSRVAIDASGTIYVADTGNQRIRKITANGVVTTLAGSTFDFADGTGTSAKFANPTGIAVDGSGTIYVADRNNQRIRKITAAGVVTTFAGSGTRSFADGTGTAAQFANPTGIAIDGSGTIYVADTNNNRIRKITTAGVVTTFAGSGTSGFAD
ncbi:MAG: hypothetical protein QM486_08455, partial [Flavobacteriaceae bacterium]